MTDNNSISRRVFRYAKVGAAAGGLVAKVAGSRFIGLNINKAEHAAELQVALGGLKGPLMKVAQIMSTVPDILPEEYIKELGNLQTNAYNM